MLKYSRENIKLHIHNYGIEGRDFTMIQDFDGILIKNHAPKNQLKGDILEIDEKSVQL